MRNHWRLPKENAFWYTGEDWLQNLLNTCDADTRNKILIMLWRAWFLRDNIIHSDGKEAISRSVAFLLKYEEVRSVQEKSEAERGMFCMDLFEQHCPDPLKPVGKQWRPPGKGVIKLNTDASVDPASGVSACGAVARNEQAAPVFSMGCKLGKCTTVEEAEGLALLSGLQTLATYYNGSIHVELDCLTLVKAISPGAANQSYLFPIVADIKTELCKFRSHLIEWVQREKNKLAHGLAAFASRNGDLLKLAGVPDELSDILWKDCNLTD
ncbi:unnamed protein product [Triticum turgidum subsp. durum]|uniref:RNase H type-1 domain-containing protein n=1 Tax=Triticum turgidum subsp. durum TaxID=4567 RepID=A0A9R0YE89_TRITD|nr:unnamed protein product [Triticum turgidum subsp. durum]